MAANGLGNPDMTYLFDDTERSKKRRKEVKEQQLLLFESSLGVLEKTFNRGSSIKDPVTRYMLFLDKLYLTFDVTLTVSEIGIKRLADDIEDGDEGIKFPITLFSRTKELINNIQNEMKKLSDWIQSPTYGPDHPLGYNMMKNCESHFTTESTDQKDSKGKEKSTDD